MKTASDVIAFMKSAPTMAALVWPRVGFRSDSYPAYYGRSSGNRMVWVGAGSPFNVYSSYVHEVIPMGEDRVLLRVDDHFPEQAIEFSRATSEADRNDWEASLGGIDESDVQIDAEMARRLPAIPDYPEPKLGHVLHFVRWSRFDRGDIVPRGILAEAPSDERGKRLFVSAFPKCEEEALGWIRRRFKADDLLLELPEFAGRMVTVSGPMSIRGENRANAMLRALHEFGADYYRETGRSMF